MNMEGVWRISNTRASTGLFSYHNAGDSGTYTSDTCASITSIPFVVAAGGTLQYDARFNLEQNWDGVVVEISTNGGSTWADLPPTGGYPGTLSETGSPPINACGYAATQGAYTGSSGGVFQAKASSLAAFAGQTVMIRWRFTSDPGAEEEGFYLDNVRLPSVGAPDPNVIFVGGFEDGETGTPSGPGCS
jgi:bacillopeptidase F (M6 metalloprotease family)